MFPAPSSTPQPPVAIVLIGSVPSLLPQLPFTNLYVRFPPPAGNVTTISQTLFPMSVMAEVAVVGDQSAIGPPLALAPLPEKLPAIRIPVPSIGTAPVT